jgi:hypothetical protein
LPNFLNGQKKHTWLFNIYLRNLHNDFLAKRLNAKYGPSVDRSRLMRINRANIIEKIDKILDNTTAKLKNHSLGIPMISQVLIDIGKGDPKSIIYEALEMREKALKFHNLINQLSDKVLGNSYEQRFEFEQQINDLTNDLQKTLKLQIEPRFIDALDLNFVLGIPNLKLSVSKLVEWVKYRIRKQEIVVLTNLSKLSVTSDFNEGHYEVFEKNCYKNKK